MKYTVTNMSQKLGVSPAEVNAALEKAGLQTQVTVESDLPGKGRRLKWAATSAGQSLSELRKGNKGANAYEILLWEHEVLVMLGFIKPPSRADLDEVQAHIVHLDEQVRVLKEQVQFLTDQLLNED